MQLFVIKEKLKNDLLKKLGEINLSLNIKAAISKYQMVHQNINDNIKDIL